MTPPKPDADPIARAMAAKRRIVEHPCAYCGKPTRGVATRAYCSASCRSMASRKRISERRTAPAGGQEAAT